MAIEKERKLSWLYIASPLLGAAGLVSLCLIGTAVPFNDSDSMNILINRAIPFPIICIGSSLGIRFLKEKVKKLAFFVSLLPMLYLIYIFAVNSVSSCGSFNCQIDSIIQKLRKATHTAECTLPILDGGDGLYTTGCGVLTVGVLATGVIHSNVEADNWLFSVQNSNQIVITIKNDGNSCPQISILDSSGSVVEGFEDKNGLLCPSGMTTTSSLYFDPPNNGTYTLRLIMPETPGTYWLKIE